MARPRLEGGELEVLAGMRRLLAEVRPVIVCEMHDTSRAFCDAMSAAGYEVFNLDGPEPIAQAGENVHALCVPAPPRVSRDRRRLTATAGATTGRSDPRTGPRAW